jgi:uncharacterized repeat protein (TIGR01451 family)
MRRRVLRRISARLLKPVVETVENRVLLATFLVTNTTDTSAEGSLRWAIGQSDTTPGSNTIDFDITGTTLPEIALTSALPVLTVPVTIDGTTEPGYSSTPLIEIDGAGAGSNLVDGFDVEGGNSTIKGLDINQFSGNAISLSIAGSDTIEDDFIGTDPTGTIAKVNSGAGVYVQVKSNNNVISDNLISGNDNNAIYLNGQLFAATNPSTSGNLITGNLLGTDITGTQVIGNKGSGIAIQNAPNTTIGGTTPAARNIISGNGSGLQLYDNSDDSVIEGNYIGTDITGEVALGNTGSNGFFDDDLVFQGISNSTVGGTVAGAGNVISGSTNNGIDCFVIGSENLAIQGNLIGTDATGTRSLGNKNDGIVIAGPAGVTIGGTVLGARNVISGNGDDGISTFANGAGLTIQGNYIGTDITGTLPLGNGGDGINSTYPAITIGGIETAAGNVVANNGYTAAFDHSGVRVTGADTPVLSNSISGNMLDGIELAGGNNAQVAPVLTSAVSTLIGSTIVGTLTAAAGSYTLQFFSTPSGTAEGETLIGTATVTVTGTSASFSEVFSNSFAPGGKITATATDLSGDTSQFSTPVTATGSGSAPGQPTISVTSTPSSVPANGNVTYTYTITNPDAISMTGVVFYDAIPVGAGFSSGTASNAALVSDVNGQAISDIGTIPADSRVTVTVVLTPSVVNVPSIVNLASVAASTPQLLPGIVTATTTSTVVGSSDLAVKITSPSGTTPVGEDATFVVKVTNHGPSLASSVSLADILPAGTTYVSSSVSSGPSATLLDGVLTDAYGSLAVGASFTLTILVDIGTGAYPTATDSASVTSSTPNPNPSDATASGSASITFVSDVVLKLVASTDNVDVGGTETYYATVTNKGPSPASDVSFTDLLPADVTLVSASASSGPPLTESSSEIADVIGTLNSGASVLITISVIPTGSTSSLLTDDATVTTTSTDPDPTNNSVTVTDNVVPVADLKIVSVDASSSSLPIGQEVTFTIDLVNNGPSTATTATIDDNLPAGLTFVSGTAPEGGVALNAGVISADIENLLSGQSTSITITAKATGVGELTDLVTVSSPVADPTTINNTGASTVTVTPVIDLSVALSGDAGPIFTGNAVTYTAVVTNNGPSPASNVVFTDPLFAGATFQSIESNAVSGTDLNGVATQSLGTIAAGASVTVTLTVIPTEPGTVTDTGSVTGTEPDSNPSNNSSSALTALIAPYQIIEFSSSNYVQTNSAGYATITLDRLGDPVGTVSVEFSTPGAGNATAGVDYQPVNMTVTFPSGVTSEVVNVPIFDNPFNNQNVETTLQLSDPTNGATLETGSPGTTPTSAILEIIDTNPDLVGPTITDLKLIGLVNSITAIEVDTTGNLNPITASYAPNYSIIALGGSKTGFAAGTVVPVVDAVYNAADGAVTLIPAASLPANELFQVTINGQGATAVSDLAGNPLNSVYGAIPGSDYALDVARGTNITYNDQNGTAVTLKLTGPGTLDIDRTIGGVLGRLQVVGGVAHKTVVTGSVHGAGKTTKIGTVLGLGTFGEIPLKLTTPPFTVSTIVFPASKGRTDPSAVDSLLTPAPTPKPVKTSKTRTSVKAEAILDPTPQTSEHTEAVTSKTKAKPKVKTAVKHPHPVAAQTVKDRSRR